MEEGEGVARVGFCPLGMAQLLGILHATANRSNRGGPGLQGCGEKREVQVWEGSLPRA